MGATAAIGLGIGPAAFALAGARWCVMRRGKAGSQPDATALLEAIIAQLGDASVRRRLPRLRIATRWWRRVVRGGKAVVTFPVAMIATMLIAGWVGLPSKTLLKLAEPLPDVVRPSWCEPTAAVPALRRGGAARNCGQARAMGLQNIPRGSPHYLPWLDRDRDGLACERWYGRRHQVASPRQSRRCLDLDQSPAAPNCVNKPSTETTVRSGGRTKAKEPNHA